MNRIQHLIEQYLNEELSPEDRLELDQWLAASEENRRFFDSLTDPEIVKEALNKMNGFDRDRVWNKFQAGIRSEDVPAKITGVRDVIDIHHVRKSNFRWAAAACVTVFLGLTTWLFLNHRDSGALVGNAGKETVTRVNEVAPGSNRATLTLADGSKITLDSARNGLLAKQSGSSVFKSDSGNISYSAIKSPGVKTANVQFNILSTPRGGQYQLSLPDGTKVWLNAASSITYPTTFTGKERKVAITGEAYFEVVHNARLPFRVQSGDQLTEDIGTAFNINAYPDESAMHTTLLEGSVKVIFKNKTELLKPGQQLMASDAGVNRVASVDLDYTMAWKNGEIGLSHGDVKKLFREISRWYNVDVEYAGAVPQGGFSASLKRNLPLSSLLKVLGDDGVHTKLEGNRIIVQ